MKAVGHTLLTFIFLLFVFTLPAQVKKKPVTKPATAIKAKKPLAKPVVKKTAEEKAIPKNDELRVLITTDLGEIIVKLYDKTPLHRDNFTKLVNDHFYDSLLFHRIISGFMIQGGDPESKNAQPGIMLGRGDIGYTIPAELDTTLYHKKGALAAARNNNPEKRSSGCQFYLVHGKKYSDEELNMIEMQNGVKFSSARRMTYKMLGGTPILDMNYTVFGEVESGLEVIDKIANTSKGNFDRPLTDIRMQMKMLTQIKDSIPK